MSESVSIGDGDRSLRLCGDGGGGGARSLPSAQKTKKSQKMFFIARARNKKPEAIIDSREVYKDIWKTGRKVSHGRCV